MKKILVIFTGGTIGSRKNVKTIDVDESTSYFLLKEYLNSSQKRDVYFETSQPLNILSENLIPSDWLILFEDIRRLNFDDYAGIIITHGTDTLPFTSAVLSYMFSFTPIPIVITASNYPLEDVRSNGLRNFINSVDFIMDSPLPGIFVLFENNIGESIVHLGTRLTEARPFSNEFDSVNSLYFGKMIDRKFVINNHKLNPTLDMIKSPREKNNNFNFEFNSEILFIKPHPGLDYRYYDFSNQKPKAVLHDLYHSGTACTRNNTGHYNSLVDFTKYCLENDVDVYISPINVSGDLYLTSNDLIQAGAIPLQNIPIEAGIVKLMLAYSSFTTKEERVEFLNKKTLFFEYVTKFDIKG